MDQSEQSARPTEIMSKPTETMSRTTEVMGSGVHVIIGSMGANQTIINGYHINGVIADNTGEAAIYQAERQGRTYVIKLYHHDKKPKAELLDKVKSIASPYIIPIIDTGTYEDRYYEVMPFYGNGDLEKAPLLDPEFIMSVVVPNVNEGLHMLHALDIIHRDIKPNNIYLSDDRHHVVIGDFGISSLMDKNMSLKVTNTSRTVGYSAPETGSGFVSKESDYYSLGITLLHLAIGADPYEGMTDTQVIMLTLNHRLDIPASVHPRLARLIRGLTLKERADRWGYEAINKWIHGQDEEPFERRQTRTDVKPYVFEGRELFGLEDLSLSLAQNWDEGIKHLYRGYISDHVKQFGQDLASKSQDCSEERDKDLGLFKLIYILNPTAPLCWRGQMYMDLYALSAGINQGLPTVYTNFVDLLTGGALLHFLQVKCYDAALVAQVEELKAASYNDKHLAYYRLARLLSDNNEFVYEQHRFFNPDDLAVYLYEQRNRIESLAEGLLDNRDFFAWLHQLGYGSQITKWKDLTYRRDEA